MKKESHIEAANCKAVLGETTFPIPSSLPFCCTWTAVDVRPVHRTKGASEEWKELGVV
jgi:hypothetical protein